MTSIAPPPHPTPDLVTKAKEEFDRDDRYGPADRVLTRVFRDFPNNTHFEDVLLKVVLLNALYNTNIYATTVMTRHILELDVAQHLDAGSHHLVDGIAMLSVKTATRRHYSFATKYCSWHRPQLFPIYDSIVERVLRQYRDRDRFASFTQADLQDYARYRSVITSFRSHYGLTGFSFKEIDKFLWLTARIGVA